MRDIIFDDNDEAISKEWVLNENFEKQDGLIQMFGPGLKGVGEKDIFEQGIDYFGLNERIDADQSITEDAFAQTAFGNGISIPVAEDKPIVLVTDFDGFGLRSYASTADTYYDLQVMVDDFISPLSKLCITVLISAAPI